MPEQYEHQFNRKTGMSHLTGKHKSAALKKKMKHPAERPESYKRDVEIGWNKGKNMDISGVKSVLRHVDKEIKKK